MGEPSHPRHAPAAAILTIHATILLSAFLLFQIQPIAARILLPAYGGSAAVWSACMLFFQSLLLAGYALPHLAQQLPLRLQPLICGTIVVLSIAGLRIAGDWGNGEIEHPVWSILRTLFLHIGIPYIILSSMSPLLQSWVREWDPRSPYRFYVSSNIGSLLALLSYPLAFEPLFGLRLQTSIWSAGYILFTAMLIACAILHAKIGPAASSEKAKRDEPAPPLHRALIPLWILYSAGGSVLLIAFTLKINQEIASVPFFWVIPLALYLLTFILCFAEPTLYRRFIVIPLFILAVWLYALHDHIHALQLMPVSALIAWACTFLGCMILHGEMVLCKPAPHHLTLFYLCMALGGALGGVFVNLAAPLIFNSLAELPLLLLLISLGSFLYLLHPDTLPDGIRKFPWFMTRTLLAILQIISLILLLKPLLQTPSGLLSQTRNFYGILTVRDFKGLRVMQHGHISHGTQRMDNPQKREQNSQEERLSAGIKHEKGSSPSQPSQPSQRLPPPIFKEGDSLTTKDNSASCPHRMRKHPPVGAASRLPSQPSPTAYYGTGSGVDWAIRTARALHPTAPFRTANIGLGAGTLAAYALEGDDFIFYEIDPEVARQAREKFGFLSIRPHAVRVVLGDGRLQLQKEQGPFHVISIDAFSGDAIPMHLITLEALRLYLDRLAPGGILAFHITNKHVDLAPILARHAQELGLHGLYIENRHNREDAALGLYTSYYVLLSRQPITLPAPPLSSNHIKPLSQTPPGTLWTDDYSNLLSALKGYRLF